MNKKKDDEKKDDEKKDDDTSKEFGLMAMDISTDDDSEESVKRRKQSKNRKILKAPRSKWKCCKCKFNNDSVSAFCATCNSAKPVKLQF